MGNLSTGDIYRVEHYLFDTEFELTTIVKIREMREVFKVNDGKY